MQFAVFFLLFQSSFYAIELTYCNTFKHNIGQHFHTLVHVHVVYVSALRSYNLALSCVFINFCLSFRSGLAASSNDLQASEKLLSVGNRIDKTLYTNIYIYTKHMTDILSSHKNVVINDSNLVLLSTLHSWQIGFQCFSNVWKILLSNGQTFAYKHAFFITSSSIHDSPFIRFALFCLSWLKSHHHLCLPAEQLLNEKNRVSEY